MPIPASGTGRGLSNSAAKGTRTDSNWGTDGAIWRAISPPLVPSVEDVELVRKACPPELIKPSAAPRILLLGVTPMLAGAAWPALSELHAVDYDEVMIDTLWQPREHAYCHCARWQEMPFPDGFFDLVIGDCSFNALPATADYAEVLREIARVSRPSAPLICRFFMQSQPRLSLGELAREAAGRFGEYSSAARRLLIPIAASEDDGTIHWTDIPHRICEQFGDVAAFLAVLGQEGEDKARALRTYELDQWLNYPSPERIREIFGQYYSEIGFNYPDYDCGQFCPIVRCLPSSAEFTGTSACTASGREPSLRLRRYQAASRARKALRLGVRSESR